METALAAEDRETILDAIERLLEAQARGEKLPPLASLEDTLTAGYAHALALDAERRRVGRELGELAAGLPDDVSEQEAEDVAGAARRLSEVERDLNRLRPVLSRLRDVVSALRERDRRSGR